MKKVFHIIQLLVFLASCQSVKTEKETDNVEVNTETEFAEFLNTYYEERLTFHPLEATFAGDSRYNDRLPIDISESYREDLQLFYEEIKRELLAFDRTTLAASDQMSYDILLWECDINLQGLKYPTHLIPLDQMWSLHLTIGQLASGTSAQPFKTVKDYENWLKRLSQFVVWTDTAIANMRKGMTNGHVLPTSLASKVIPQLDDLDGGPAKEHLFYSPVAKMPDDFSAEDKERLTIAYTDMVENLIIPAFSRLHSFMLDEYLAATRSSSGIAAVPNGEAYYNYMIKRFTTTEMTADEIFELGKTEVARIRGEMEKVKKQVGFEGDLQMFFDHVRNNKELMPYQSADEVIANFNEIHERMKPQLSTLFDLVPKTNFEVRRTEAFREASASAEYNPGSKDGSRPGIFYVPVPDASSYNTFSDESLFLHEAIPGHHYQISLQQENENLPEFRKFLWYSAYGEGWALYSESLGKELGLYTDPYQYFGMLSAEMHRAIRLVVDAGMHAKGWTREQAIQYSLENEAESEASITSEIERYMAMPGQALSYKIGQLKIMELRARATEELGDDFNIKTFHNKVLESGCVPLKLLEDKINDWIAEKQSQ